MSDVGRDARGALGAVALAVVLSACDPDPPPATPPSAPAAAVTAPSPAAPPAPLPAAPAPVAPTSGEVGPVGDHDLAGWLAEREARARAGAPETVRIALAWQGSGWGCSCPERYLGVDGISAPSEIFIDPIGEGTLERIYDDDGETEGVAELVVGHFTGETSSWTSSDPVDPYILHRFVIEYGLGPITGEEDGLYRTLEGCRRIVADPAAPLRVRAAPGSGARVVGELPNDTEVHPVAASGRWLRIDQPVVGFVWRENTREVCPPRT